MKLVWNIGGGHNNWYTWSLYDPKNPFYKSKATNIVVHYYLVGKVDGFTENTDRVGLYYEEILS